MRGVFGLLSQFERKAHPIRLSAALKADLEWWHVFASSWNGVSMMLPEDPGVEIWSDASGSWGCGAMWEAEWLQLGWSGCGSFYTASIAAKELLPIVLATAVWGPLWEGSVVLCHCDNQAVVDVLRGGYSRDPVMAQLLRALFYLEAKDNITLTACHVAGVDNGPADAISRDRLDLFFRLVPQASRVARQVPAGLVEKLVDLNQWTSEDWTSWLGIILKDR